MCLEECKKNIKKEEKSMTKKNSKHGKNKKIKNKKISQENDTKRNKKIVFFIILILLLLFIISLQNNTKKLTYDNTQIILNNENITANLQDDIIIENQKVYMSFEDIQKFLDETIYQEEETGLVITTGDKKLATFKQDDENITINGSNQQIKDVLKEKNGKKYIAISELENVYDYDFEYIQNTNIATIDYLNKECIKAYATKNIKIKEENKTFSSSIDEVEKGNWLIYINEEDGMAKVRTQNGIIGYVKRSSLDNFVTERENFDEQQSTEQDQEYLAYDISGKDLSTFEKRLDIINLILQETIKNDKMYVQITYNGTEDFNFERFKIEVIPVLRECGITVNI